MVDDDHRFKFPTPSLKFSPGFSKAPSCIGFPDNELPCLRKGPWCSKAVLDVVDCFDWPRPEEEGLLESPPNPAMFGEERVPTLEENRRLCRSKAFESCGMTEAAAQVNVREAVAAYPIERVLVGWRKVLGLDQKVLG